MNFHLPLVEEKPKRQQIIALHLTVSFALIATGAFILMFRYLVNNIEKHRRGKFIDIRVPGEAGLIILIIGLAFLILLISRNRWIMSPKSSIVLRAMELLAIASFAAFAFYHRFWMPAVVYCIIIASIIFSFFRKELTKTSCMSILMSGE